MAGTPLNAAMHMNHVAKNAIIDKIAELRAAAVAAAPMYMPSHVNAGQPKNGMSMSQGRKVPVASITAASEVINFMSPVPARM